MKNKFILGAGLLSAGAIMWAAKDPVVMTVNGVDVPKSEFEYLYHKNSQQQLNAQPIDEYVEMFKLYKLKVADALADGLDTTSTFRSEMAQYRRDLAAPYLADSVYLNKLVQEAFKRSREEVQANHIMVLKGRTGEADLKARARIDSIRTALLDGADFDTLAGQVSEDQSARINNGNLGYIAEGRFPYNFEVAAYSLKPGEISEIVESPMAYHVLKGGERRPSRGMVLVSHIMKMVKPGSSPEIEASAKAAIDSIYQAIMADPSSFEKIARNSSDDPGSARMGGQLPWFGVGQMVPEFQEASYALADGEISAPVRSPFGWHIIKKRDHKDAAEFNEMRSELLKKVTNPRDERSKLIRDNQTAKLAKKHKAKYDAKAVANLRTKVGENGLDSVFYASYTLPNPEAKAVLFTIEGRNYTASDFIGSFGNMPLPDAYMAQKVFDERLDGYYNNALIEAEENTLEATEPEYRNLLNEYRDGSLLYEASVRRVWDKAAKDEEGLKKYFEANRADYSWKEPKAKGILIQAKSDSVAALVKAKYPELGADSALQTLRKDFRNEIQVDKVLASQGTNRMVDNLLFNGPAVETEGSAYPVYFMLDPRVLTAPEEMSDVRGQVTQDYQALLEKEWIAELKAKYPVTVNEKELKKVK